MMGKEELEELKYKQGVAPELLEKLQGNIDSAYEFPEHEVNMVHVEMDVILPFDQATGKRLTAPFPQKFWPREYHEANKRGGFAGYNVRMLHKPAELELIESQEAKKKSE